jgi:hypothetical protein
MTDQELKDLLNLKIWGSEERQNLINEWNKRRTDVPNIGINSVRTPCRIRQVVSSFKLFLEKN